MLRMNAEGYVLDSLYNRSKVKQPTCAGTEASRQGPGTRGWPGSAKTAGTERRSKQGPECKGEERAESSSCPGRTNTEGFGTTEEVVGQGGSKGQADCNGKSFLHTANPAW